MSQNCSFPEWSGQHSGVTNAATVVAKTQAEWEKLWEMAHSSSYPKHTPPKLPANQMAVAIFTGQSNLASQISIASVEEKGGKTVVNWNEKSYRQSMAVMNEPFYIKWVDKTDSEVVFKKASDYPPLPRRNGPQGPSF